MMRAALLSAVRERVGVEDELLATLLITSQLSPTLTHTIHLAFAESLHPKANRRRTARRWTANGFAGRKRHLCASRDRHQKASPGVLGSRYALVGWVSLKLATACL